MLIYLLHASAGIALFFMLYWLFLRKETFHSANRWFMLGSLVLAVALPLIPVQYEVLVGAQSRKPALQTISDTFKNIPVFAETEETTSSFSWIQATLLIYLTGAAIFMIRLLTQTVILIHLMIKYQVKSLDGIRIVENEKYGLPFSFFNIVFINPKFHTQDELPEILAHEKVHIRENHWFDLLFIELLTVIFWFNPFIWLFERCIKQNHEYLADKGVLAQGHTVGKYQAILVNQLMGMQIIGITNNLNFALGTNRLKMMTKKKTPNFKRAKFAWILPIVALLLFAFAEPQYRYAEPELSVDGISTPEPVQKKTVKLAGLILDENGDPLPGTSVVVKGMTIGTVSGMDGTFKLEVPENKSIVLSFVGKTTVEDKFSGITSGHKTDNVFNREYQLKDDVIYIGAARELKSEREVPPPPPPPKKEKLIKGDASKMDPPPPPPPPKNGEAVFFIVEDLPAYPGGSDALNNYVYKMQKKVSTQKKVKGNAKVLFTVSPTGTVTDIKVVEKDNEGAGKGAYLIAKEMKNWTPGKQRGKAVPVKYLMPVEFK